MSKHTPGPWTYQPDEPGLAGAITAKTGWICDFDTDPSPENARLIAAAPELLEAATKALHALNAIYIQCDVACVVEPEGEIYLRPVINALRQVIAKATGEA